MQRRKFINSLGGVTGLLITSPILASELKVQDLHSTELKSYMPGVWRFTIGTPEKITPQSTRTIEPAKDGFHELPVIDTCPVKLAGSVSQRGVLVQLPLKANEYVYGLGLQLQSFQQRGLKKMLRVNADPSIDSGDSHAPVPFFVTTSGYGILIDTARYATVYVGNKKRRPNLPVRNEAKREGMNALTGAYDLQEMTGENEILIEVPRSEGVDVYVFGGPTMLQAVQRYNLFAGGGALPPRWGLGFWYRVQSDFTQDQVKGMARYFRDSKIPCDVLGLEPHWQTAAYSCSYVWSDLFPKPAQMLNELKEEHFRVNLWEHAFVNPCSPIYKDLIPYSGDYEVWGGLVPDFITKEGRTVYSNFHQKEHVDLGASGYKADECDNSDYTGNWSYPEISRFPSGADGEQMHCLIGIRYQDTIKSIFDRKKERTYGLVRSSGALASPYPFVIYSDLYNHRNFIHGIAQSGFSGLLWTPEVRDAKTNEDLIRRLQTVVFSPLAMINAWYMKNAPWKQIEQNANNQGRFAENWEKLEAQCREIIELRMKLIPYIYSAFVQYHKKGIPPFRALVMDYPNDQAVCNLSNQFLVGDSMLVAPVVEGEKNRNVYLPEGDWYNFWTSKKYTGKCEYNIEVPIEQIPVFIKSGTILPLAQPTLHTEDPDSFKLTALVFGENVRPAILFEDDGSWSPLLKKVKLEWDSKKQKGNLVREGKATSQQYSVTEWKFIS
ncbi:MAG: glycoside hydrolase family 31 protein [Bacteroidota bacterium]|nr:glycoside hydrolase family 31 protein [Bacteroidota bacterium]